MTSAIMTVDGVFDIRGRGIVATMTVGTVLPDVWRMIRRVSDGAKWTIAGIEKFCSVPLRTGTNVGLLVHGPETIAVGDEVELARMTGLDVLVRARGRIAQGFTKGAYARDAEGKEAFPSRIGHAVSWSLTCALMTNVSDENAHCIARSLLGKAIGLERDDLGNLPLKDWAEAPERTQGDVLIALTRAIDREREKGDKPKTD